MSILQTETKCVRVWFGGGGYAMNCKYEPKPCEIQLLQNFFWGLDPLLLTYKKSEAYLNLLVLLYSVSGKEVICFSSKALSAFGKVTGLYKHC